MMYRSSLLTLALGSLVIAAACGDSSVSPNTNTNASVGFVNATASTIRVANGGVVGTGNGSLGFGGVSSCMTVNPNNTSALTFTNTSTGAPITGFTPSFTNGGRSTVIAYTGTNGTTQFATINNTFTPTTGQAGVRVFNAANGSGSLVTNSGGAALNGGAGVAFGNGGTFFSVPSGAQSFSFNTGAGTTTVGTANNLALTAGQNYILVVGPAATGTTALRTTLVPAC